MREASLSEQSRDGFIEDYLFVSSALSVFEYAGSKTVASRQKTRLVVCKDHYQENPATAL